MGNSLGRLIVVTLIVIEKDGSRILSAANIFCCSIGRLIELSGLELPSSIVTGVI